MNMLQQFSSNCIFGFRQGLSKFCEKTGMETAHLPSFIYIVVNRACNLKCKMCDIGSEQKKSNLSRNLKTGERDMDFQDLKKIIDQFQKKSFVRIIFNSTEPLLYPKIINAIKYVKQNKLICKIATNGFLLPEFAKDLIKSGLDNLVISVDGPEKIHDKIRGVKGSYGRIIEGLQKIQKYKKHKNTPSIRINTTISEHNHNNLVQTIEELQNLGIDKFFLSHLNVVTKKMKEEHNKKILWYPTDIKSSILPKNINTNILYNQLKEIREIRREYDITIYEDPPLNKAQIETYYKHPECNLDISKKCRFPWFASQILVNGDVVPIMRCMNIILGNIHQQNFKDIWNGEKYRTLRKYINHYKYFPACKRCCGIFPKSYDLLKIFPLRF